MPDDSADEFSGIFDNLSPQDFFRDTSARDVAVLNERPNLDVFVSTHIEALRIAFHAADGTPNPVAVMHSPSGRRIYSPDDDESLGQYIARLAREAKTHQATSLFTAVLTVGGAYVGEGLAADSPEAMAQVEPKPCLYWYAEYRSERVRHGILAVEGGETGEVFEAPGEHASALYRTVLAYA